MSSILAAAPTSVAALPFKTVNLPESMAELAGQNLSERLGKLGVQTITPAEIQALLGQERQKELLGCSERAEACTAELVDALGADASMLGTLARLGDTIELSIKVVSNRNGKRLAGYTERVRDEGALFDVLDRAAVSLAAQLHPPPAAVAGEVVAGHGEGLHLRRWTLVPAIVGGVALLGAGGAWLLGYQAHLDLVDPARPAPLNPQARVADGNRWQTLSALSAGLAVVCGALTAWFYFSGEAPAVTPVLALVGGAPGFALTGALP